MAKKIMIQGTMSNSGKSFVAAALCRILKQDGYRVAPFKSQNMALNSYITKDGLEIGRAQAMQAEAAGIAPTVDMNPILLKPTSQMGSQVIVNGEVFGNLRAMDYYRRKTEFIPAVREAFERLESQFDAIVLEGAGSPAEINLRDNDIVNMGMAKIANAPVLLVGDIDRGGVFASLYGTVSLLEPEERARIKGLIINKFRGDVKILEPGLRMIEERLHIPVVGVIPMEQIDLDDEDSLSDRLVRTEVQDGLDVAVIHLPHISNFTDFNALEHYEGVSLRYVDRAAHLGRPDPLHCFYHNVILSIFFLFRQAECSFKCRLTSCIPDSIPGFCLFSGLVLFHNLIHGFHIQGAAHQIRQLIVLAFLIFFHAFCRRSQADAFLFCQLGQNHSGKLQIVKQAVEIASEYQAVSPDEAVHAAVGKADSRGDAMICPGGISCLLSCPRLLRAIQA